jgi:hypothetical protein
MYKEETLENGSESRKGSSSIRDKWFAKWFIEENRE